MRACEKNDTIRTTIIATAGGSTSQGEIHASTAKNKNTNGRSTKVVRLAEAMKSRTVSKERKFAANEPTDTGRFSIRKSSTCSIICAESVTSTRLLAASTT